MTDATFLSALSRIPDGYVRGKFDGRLWGATIKRSADGRRIWLFAEELAGTDIVSFNLYRIKSGAAVLKPCEMSCEKVIEFVLGFSVTPEL
ncbi:hypothetical protein [Agrobacterium rosae]|jgi:hypothetical protein|uniref:Peptide methionine sulfoxide reductase n=1 Tax=Agrobacterium rosae TaxID=1972867 RepID=A0A1R3U6Y2_9HYPH|nr:hypothetical protein [Agrobacterium rosae]KAA3515358.1 hypothetical protein DXM21_00590 [Agrobacterium rosae]KAA3524326.1 hypothetical protein DXM25_00590 [Agrobacterium rosae]MBN7804390.1 hypothetical protein [Agrobacterium rosae]MCM2431219.1 hypothetical protein [Agrobacterium rosae]MDX8302180.1 hypothetical protein [Agrobacterium rosae]